MGLVLCYLPFISTLGALCLLASKLREQSAAAGAGMGEGLEVGSKLAVRIAAAAIEGAFLLTYSLYQFAAALGAVNPNLDLKRFGVLTLRVSATGNELTKAPRFDY